MRAPIRGRRSFHADMHGKREAAQVIGTMMGSLSRVHIAKFDARPTCTPTFSGARSVKFVGSGPELKLPTEKLRRTDAAESGEDAWVRRFAAQWRGSRREQALQIRHRSTRQPIINFIAAPTLN